MTADEHRDDLMTLPRGLRNCNPGNIEHGDQWQGLAEKQTDPRFCTFTEMKWGVRAIAKILQTYQRPPPKGHGLNTIREFITRWAPPERHGVIENDTEAYIQHVSEVAGMAPSAPVDVMLLSEVEGIIKAIIRHENGMDLPDPKDLRRGLALAGVIGAEDYPPNCS